MSIYFDYASTTKIRKEVYEAMLPYLESEFGNPSSLYDIGISNKKLINQCRKKIANLIYANANEIYFCSGGSEANNWALKGIAFKNKIGKEIITTKIEHHSILHSCQFLENLGYTVHYLAVDNEGFVNLKALERLINTNTILVSIMMANNEIGTIQNIKDIGLLCKKHNVIFHTDAIQGISHIPINVEAMNIDLMSISGHKFYAPKGIGCLYIRNGVEIENLIHGGAQEKNKRAGTENIAYIVGMTKGLEIVTHEMATCIIQERELAQYLYDKLKAKVSNWRLNGPAIGKNRLPGNLNLSFKDCDGALLNYNLNKVGICVSTGSACNSNMIEASHVLQAIKVPDAYINGTIRITLGRETTKADIDKLVAAITSLI